MLLRCCLIHISIVKLRYFLYLLYLCPCLDLCLFMSYLCDLSFIFIFVMMNLINAEALRYSSGYLSEYVQSFLDDSVDEGCE